MVMDEEGPPEASPPTLVLDVHGQLDRTTAPALCREVDAAASGPATRVVVDLGDVTACDAHGLRALVGAAREATVRLSRLVIAVEARSALDRLITRAGVREFVRVVNRPMAGPARRRAVTIRH